MKYFTPVKLSENMKETPEGFLVCLDVPIARTGWQQYGPGETPIEVGSDGKVHVYRDPLEVFSVNTISSFEGKPLTIDHPLDFVDPDNWKVLAKGVLQNVRRSNKKDEEGEESLLSDILISDGMAIKLVKDGLREVSCGYDAIYEQTEVGKARQVQIVGNHLALVREGRAGPSYAIRDHKTERSKKMAKLADKIRGVFTKSMDEALKEVEKETESKDDGGKVEQKADGSISFDEVMKAVKDLAGKIDSLGTKTVSGDAESTEKKETESKDVEVEASLEDRLKRLEALVAKITEGQAEEMGDAESEESEDEEEPDSMTADTAMRAEILCPGIKMTKDVKERALMEAYKTKEGKEVMDSLASGKPTFDSKTIDMLFISTSELLKQRRGVGLDRKIDFKALQSKAQDGSTMMTAEKMNELNEKHYKRN